MFDRDEPGGVSEKETDKTRQRLVSLQVNIIRRLARYAAVVALHAVRFDHAGDGM